jgi:hypothetical protein
MATPAKLLHVIGLTGKTESTYGVSSSPTTTADGVQLQFTEKNVTTPFTIDYAFDGDLGPGVGSLGSMVRVAPSGRSVKGDLPTRARPGGAAYSSSVVPSIHALLKAAGFDGTVTTTGGSEKWAYTPTVPGTGYASLSANLYSMGELMPVLGLLADLKVDFANPAPPIWTFMTSSILSALPTDVAAPSITYPLQTVAPPLASSVALTLGSLTSANAAVISGSFALKRVIEPRVILSASGAHLGFVPGARQPELTVTLEQTALTGSAGTAAATFDPYNLRDLALQVSVLLQFGTAQYNKYKFAMTQMQVISATPANNGPTACTTLVLRAPVTTATANDDLTITFD